VAVTILKALSPSSSGVSEDNHENLSLGRPVTQPNQRNMVV